MSGIVQLIWAIVISMLPVTELRIGLPIAIDYAIKSSISVWLVFFLVLLAKTLFKIREIPAYSDMRFIYKHTKRKKKKQK